MYEGWRDKKKDPERGNASLAYGIAWERIGPFIRRQSDVPSRYIEMSTNRSVGSQPEIQSRRIFAPRPLNSCEWACGQKCSIKEKNVAGKTKNQLTGSGS